IKALRVAKRGVQLARRRGGGDRPPLLVTPGYYETSALAMPDEVEHVRIEVAYRGLELLPRLVSPDLDVKPLTGVEVLKHLCFDRRLKEIARKVKLGPHEHPSPGVS
ncbi:hypothetical protein, partial [Enterococcus faecium]|uniref:hypothetical protein n=1 Tax=Enterococcus faecium TaxID=1352 RepID=UPI0030C892E8